MTSPIQFSCVIPTHDRPALLAESLASVLSQEDAESLVAEVVVVIDDCSQDAQDVVARAAAAHPHIRVRSVLSDRSPRGAAQSRNVGAASTRGVFLAFLDDDDLWMRHHLAQAARAITDEPDTQALVAPREFRPLAGAPRTEKLDSRVVSADHAFRAGCVATGSNLIIRRDVFKALNGYDPSLPVLNDTDFFVRLQRLGVTPMIMSTPSVVIPAHEADQLTRPNERRARGMRVFYAKHRTAMEAGQRRGFRYRMFGMHRLTSRGLLGRSYYTALQLANADVRVLARKLSNR